MPVSSRLRALLPMGLSYAASGGSLIVSSAAQLLTFAILARCLGVEEFSIFIALTAITAVAIQICGLGAQEALVRRVAREPALYPRFLGHNILISGISGLVLVVLGVVILPQVFALSADPLINLTLLFVVLVTNIVLARVILLVEQIFIAHSNFAAANRNVIFFALGRLAAAVLGCLVFGADTLAEWIVWAFVAHAAIAVLSIRSASPLGRPSWVFHWDEMRNGILFSTPFILRALRQNVDLLLLSALTSAEGVASYAVARRIVDSGYLSVEALNRLLYPGSAAATRDGLHQALGRFRKVLAVSIGIAVVAALVLVCGAPLLPLLFGAEYVSLPGFTQILAPTIVLMAAWATAQEALGSSGHHLERAMIFNGAVVLGGVGIALATWLEGTSGAFFAIYATELATAVAAWLVLLRLADRDRHSLPKTETLAPVHSK